MIPPPEPGGLAPCLEVALRPREPTSSLLAWVWGTPLRNWLSKQEIDALVRPIFPDLDVGNEDEDVLKLLRWQRIYLPHMKHLHRLHELLSGPTSPVETVCFVPEAPPPPARWNLLPGQRALAPARASIGLALPNAPALPDPVQDLSPWAHHRQLAPAGVGPSKKTGADGGTIALADVEHGWALDGPFLRHPYLQHVRPNLLGEINHPAGADHGTRALGVIYAVDRDAPTGEATGLANASGRLLLLANRRRVAETMEIQTTADQIGHATERLYPGAILLVEAQTLETKPSGPNSLVPSEYEGAVYDAVRRAVNKGVIVIAAAGNGHFQNGSTSLDSILLPNGQCPFDRALRDSGAVLVGAGSWMNNQWGRMNYSNYGTRIDCFAAGENVLTTSYGPTDASGIATACLCDDFNGTSAAAAIIAGVARSLQGMALARCGALLTPTAMRRLLSDPTLGTPCAAGHQIGVMPDLERLAAVVARLPPGDFL